MNIQIPCKICRQVERGRPQILVFINDLLRRGYSLRKITKLVYQKYSIYISKSSVSIHKTHYLNPKPIEDKVETYYSAMGRIETKY